MSEVIQAGSNIFELIEFTVLPKEYDDFGQEKKATAYGVNVAKVREVIRLPQIVPCISRSPEVLGVFNLRGMPIPAIHLARVLGYKDAPVLPSFQVIVTEFSRRVAGFVVASTRRIRRVSWDRILPPSSEAFDIITGMMLLEDNDFLFMLDFEQILMSIESRSMDVNAGQHVYARDVSTSMPLAMVIDDSSVARRAISDMLRSLGFRVNEFTDGEQAWQALCLDRDAQNLPHVIISDIEMPRLDGYSLVRRVREDKKMAGIPIILHSSLSADMNRDRAKSVGADGYVTKLNKKEIVQVLSKFFPQLMNASLHGLAGLKDVS